MRGALSSIRTVGAYGIGCVYGDAFGANPDGLTLKGSGEVHGDIGPCPFCISFGKTIGMQYKNGSWDVDF